MSNDNERTRLLPHILIHGNPVDGLAFYGPFPDRDSAIIAGNTDAHLDGDWWIAPVEPLEG